jgi:hypothetical protein
LAPNPNSQITLDAKKIPWLDTSDPQLDTYALKIRSIRKIKKLPGQQVGRAVVARVKLMEYLQDENDSS